MRLAEEVLSFWFGNPNITGEIKNRKIWFQSNVKFDNEIRRMFLKEHKKATVGKLDYMKNNKQGCLALIIILDQFSRNLYRGSPKAFEMDPKAQKIANFAVQRNYDKQINKVNN